MPMLQITLQDQFDQHHLASASLKTIPLPCHAESVAQHVEHNIYRIVDVVDLPNE